ncbi:MAG TPA: hypothetical protein VHD15_17790 [Hyphomicrobiales bacterium]|nr:hypothetical protein [Hyphomicrobiales bacterium]
MADDDGKAASEDAHRRSNRPRSTLDLDATDVSPSEAAGPATAQPAVGPAPRRAGWLGHVLAAIVGAAIAVAAIWALAENGRLPAAGAGDTASAVATLQGKMGALDQRLAGLERQAKAPPPAADDQAARAGIDKLQAGTAALGRRLDELEKAVAADHDALGAKASAGDVAKLAQQVQANRAGTPTDADLAGRLGRAETALAGKASTADVARLGQEVAALQASLKTLDAGHPGQAATEAHAAATLAAVAALDGALARGTPFEDDLADIQHLVGDQDLKPLQRYAAKGAPPLHALASRLAADLAAAPPTPLPSGAGLFDRLYASLRGLVRVTPAAPSGGVEPTGDSDAAKRARVIARLDRGDYRGAIEAWQALDASARKATATAEAALSDRLAADQRLGEIGRRALAALAGAAGSGK